MTFTENQLRFLLRNNSRTTSIVGHAALENNSLLYGNNFLTVYTPYDTLDNLTLGDVRLENYHYGDSKFMRRVGDKLYLPTREKAIIDTIAFLDKNYNEGELIEALQNYSRMVKEDYSKLYEVADYYKVSRETVDYWINEANEESDMSMG